MDDRIPPGRPYRKSADLGRTAVGLIWIAGAIFNLVWTMRHTGLYQGFADNAPLAVVRWFFGDVVMAHGTFWTALLVIGELALGVLTLGKGPWARAGITGSVAWSAFLFVLLPPYTLMMGPFAVAIAWLLGWDYPHTAPHLFRHQERPHVAGRHGSGTIAP